MITLIVALVLFANVWTKPFRSAADHDSGNVSVEVFKGMWFLLASFIKVLIIVIVYQFCSSHHI